MFLWSTTLFFSLFLDYKTIQTVKALLSKDPNDDVLILQDQRITAAAGRLGSDCWEPMRRPALRHRFWGQCIISCLCASDSAAHLVVQHSATYAFNKTLFKRTESQACALRWRFFSFLYFLQESFCRQPAGWHSPALHMCVSPY